MGSVHAGSGRRQRRCHEAKPEPISHLRLWQLRQGSSQVELRGKGLPKAQEGALLRESRFCRIPAQLLQLLEQLPATTAEHDRARQPGTAQTARGGAP